MVPPVAKLHALGSEKSVLGPQPKGLVQNGSEGDCGMKDVGRYLIQGQGPGKFVLPHGVILAEERGELNLFLEKGSSHEKRCSKVVVLHQISNQKRIEEPFPTFYRRRLLKCRGPLRIPVQKLEIKPEALPRRSAIHKVLKYLLAMILDQRQLWCDRSFHYYLARRVLLK